VRYCIGRKVDIFHWPEFQLAWHLNYAHVNESARVERK